MVHLRQELQDLSDHVWRRLRARLEGLTDDEYLWEPAPGCWTVRPRSDGTWMADWPLPRPDPEPFTTLAWRLWHVIDMYGEDRAPRWLDVPPQGRPIGIDGDEGPPATAEEAVTLLERAHDRWDAHLAMADDERLVIAIGEVAGPEYADRSRAAYVLHMLDEFIHHGAEIGLLRDLWRWQHPVAEDPVVERIMRGDEALVDELGAAATSDQVRKAADYGRWGIVLGLLDLGAPLPTEGRSPLHTAAGAGEVAVVEALLAHGADASQRDDVFHATAREWADFLRHPTVAALLRERE